MRSGLAAALLLVVVSTAHAHGDIGADRWSFDPAVVVPLLVSALLYARGLSALWSNAGTGRGVTRLGASSFAAGWAVTALALVTPLDHHAAEQFSVHMIQHELLMTVAAPLLVLGRPLAVWARAFAPERRRVLAAVTHSAFVRVPWVAVTGPVAAIALHGVTIWVWHVPALFDAALANPAVHTLQHLTFLGTALVFWWNAV